MHVSDFSVITITHNRNEHLANLIRGIEHSSVQPAELVIVYINQPTPLRLQSSVHIREIHIDSDRTLPLARARNVGANEASFEQLIFLDVDCIPSHDMFERMLSVNADLDKLVMGTPRYVVPGKSIEKIDDVSLDSISVEHTNRRQIQEGKTDTYTLFWSLCFSISRSVFHKIGGFDERYTGYGGEDTDFALMAEKYTIPFYITSAQCYHQYHSVYKPPVQHLEDIVLNSNYFYDKWQIWPMEGWLQKFVDLDLIDWTPQQTVGILVLRTLSNTEIASFEDTVNAY